MLQLGRWVLLESRLLEESMMMCLFMYIIRSSLEQARKGSKGKGRHTQVTERHLSRRWERLDLDTPIYEYA